MINLIFRLLFFWEAVLQVGEKPGYNGLADPFARAKHQFPAHRIQGEEFNGYCTLFRGGRRNLYANLGAIAEDFSQDLFIKFRFDDPGPLFLVDDFAFQPTNRAQRDFGFQ